MFSIVLLQTWCRNVFTFYEQLLLLVYKQQNYVTEYLCIKAVVYQFANPFSELLGIFIHGFQMKCKYMLAIWECVSFPYSLPLCCWKCLSTLGYIFFARQKDFPGMDVCWTYVHISIKPTYTNTWLWNLWPVLRCNQLRCLQRVFKAITI